MDPDTRRLVMFAGGLGAVLVALIGASALIGHHSSEVPVITADSRPIRVKPDNPGGMKIDGAENDVFSGGSDTADSKLAPAAETPDAKALGSGAAPPPADDADGSTTAPPLTARQAAAPPSARPNGGAGAPATSGSATGGSAANTSAPGVPAVRAPAGKVASARPQAQAAVETHPTVSGHQAMVQLAALTSEQAAHSEWQHLSRRMPDLMNGRQPIFTRTERDGHTFWRVRTAGFSDLAQARTFCDRVRQKGGGCSVADF
jgi:hypothetical protein